MASTKVCTFAAICVLCTLIPSSEAHTFFATNLTGTLGDASFNGYTHSGNFFYNLTSPALTNETITSAKLVIGNPADATTTNPITAVTLQGPVAPDSTVFAAPEEGEEAPDPPVYGMFTEKDISPAAVATFSTNNGGTYDLLQVACKGDLYVVLETMDQTEIYAPLNYVPSVHAPEKTCEESAIPYVPAAAAPAGSAPSIAAASAASVKNTCITGVLFGGVYSLFLL